MPTRTTERVVQHRLRVKERNQLIDGFIRQIIETGDIRYTLTPVSPYPRKDPLKDGIKVTYVMSKQA